MRLIIGMSGATGIIYGIRLLELLKPLPQVETHLIMSATARMNVTIETDWKMKDIEALAGFVHNDKDLAASLSSGSFKTDGMIVAPCAMKTLSGIVHSYADTLLVRAADVVLKEQRKLVLVPRESPLHVGHTKLLYEAAQLGAIIAPPVPAFYNRPQSIDDLVTHTAGRLLDLFDIDCNAVTRWTGIPK